MDDVDYMPLAALRAEVIAHCGLDFALGDLNTVRGVTKLLVTVLRKSQGQVPDVAVTKSAGT